MQIMNNVTIEKKSKSHNKAKYNKSNIVNNIHKINEIQNKKVQQINIQKKNYKKKLVPLTRKRNNMNSSLM